MKRNIISIFVLMLLLSSTVSSLSIFDNNYKMKTIYSAECPEDFELFIYCGGLDTVKLIFTLQVNSGGEVKYSHFNKTTDTFNLVSEFDFSNQELNQIWDEIVTNTFFDLDNYYAKDSVYGGSFANITVTGNGITHTVQTENINIEAGSFNAVSIPIFENNAHMYYSESEGNIIQLTGYLSEYIPIVEDINLELKE
jgi:hypothetical protein